MTQAHTPSNCKRFLSQIMAKKILIAQNLHRHLSKKVEAAFCMKDLQKLKIGSLRMISVTNPHTKREKAEKKIDILRSNKKSN